MANTPVQIFSECCFRIGAAVIALPAILVGAGFAIAGLTVAIGLLVPGCIIAGLVFVVTGEFIKTSLAGVSFCILDLGVGMIYLGLDALKYAYLGNNGSNEYFCDPAIEMIQFLCNSAIEMIEFFIYVLVSCAAYAFSFFEDHSVEQDSGRFLITN